MSGAELLICPLFRVISGEVEPDRMYWVPSTFRFVKFRTMYADARRRFPELYNYAMTPYQVEQFQFKVERDPRVTRAGKWLRISTLDELPNFICVLTGEMRLAGPRPEIPEMLPNYRPEQMAKFTVKPGVSGLAQIKGRGRLSFQRTVSYDLEYVRTRSFALDLKIMLSTLFKVFKRHGAF
jgi:lipopolysaccharide/colanic/teichoic acid biosynthesis glycosyltransferase